MTVDERRRIELFERLSTAIGPEAAATMSELFPPPGAAPATQAGLAALREDMRAGFADVDQRFDAIDQRFADGGQRFAVMDQRFAVMDQRFETMDAKLDTLRYELLAAFRGELVTAVSGQTRAVIVATATATFGIGGLAVTLAQLL